MKEVVITADSTCDLPKSIIEKNKKSGILNLKIVTNTKIQKKGKGKHYVEI